MHDNLSDFKACQLIKRDVINLRSNLDMNLLINGEEWVLSLQGSLIFEASLGGGEGVRKYE